ncbi:MAG: hypothetical protein IJ682_12550 [Lachnospiraceae bacterium]|nr:hypothetical protein [Lachnospiraceae bacterium]
MAINITFINGNYINGLVNTAINAFGILSVPWQKRMTLNTFRGTSVFFGQSAYRG